MERQNNQEVKRPPKNTLKLDELLKVSRELEESEGLQWGKPGPGGAYWRSSAITGQGFFDKMGWCGSADPRKRPVNTKHGEADQMRRDIDEIRERREAEHQDNNSSEGLELVPLMKNQITGRPAKDPATGYMMSHGLSSTDVTRMADKKGANQYASSRNDNKQRYSLEGSCSSLQAFEAGGADRRGRISITKGLNGKRV